MRLKIAKRTELAVRALQVLGADRRVKASEIASAVGSSPAFVAQVVKPLVAVGWVRSEPGPTGGYELLVPLDSISLLDLIEACEGPTDDGRCVLESRACRPSGPCALHEPWIRARQSLISSLDGIAVSAVVRPPDPVGPQSP